MGQYEPDDSRNVTLKQGHEPGSAKRTGPREDEARAKAQRREDEKADKKRADDGPDAARNRPVDPAER